MPAISGLTLWQARDAVLEALIRDGLVEEQAVTIANSAFPADTCLQTFSLVELFLTRACNLACPYCFVHEKAVGTTMCTKTAERAAKWIIDHGSTTTNMNVVFMGGEPLLAMEPLRIIVEALREEWKKRKTNLRFDLTTNGTLIDAEMAEFLARAGIMTLISMDGSRERHDKTRVFPSGKGSFDLVSQALKNVRKYQGFAGVRMTIQPTEFQWILHDVMELADLGAQSFILGRVTGVDWTEKQLVGYYSEVEETRKWMATQKGLRIVDRAANEMKSGALKNSWGCRAGKVGIAVNWDGNLYPCSKVIGVDPKSIGGGQVGSVFSDLADNSVLQALRGDRVTVRHECFDCEIRDNCAGGCFATNFESTGELFKPGSVHWLA